MTDDEPLIHPDDLADWARRVLLEIEHMDDYAPAPATYKGENGEPLLVGELRERMRGALTRLAVERQMRDRRGGGGHTPV